MSNNPTDRITSIVYQASLVLLVPAILYSRAMITILLILLFLSLLFRVAIRRSEPKTTGVFLFCCIPAAVLISGINSANTDVWMHALMIKLPFVLIPIAYKYSPSLSERFVTLFFWVTICVFVSSSLPVLLEYYQNYDQMIDRLSQGKPIPTPIEHVKYSMFNAFVVIWGLYRFAFGKGNRIHQMIILVATLWLLWYMHVLAVRTGLVIVYVSVFVLLVKAGLRYGWRQMVMGAGIFLVVGIAAFQSSDSLKTKLSYMYYDWQQSQADNKGVNYSDSERFLSWQMGWRLIKKEPILGVGVGDIDKESTEEYASMSMPTLFKKPHNQFIYTTAAMGIVGLILFLVGFYGPLIGRYHIPMISYLYLNYSLSFLVENSVERSMSVAFFIVMMIVLGTRLSTTAPYADELQGY